MLAKAAASVQRPSVLVDKVPAVTALSTMLLATEKLNLTRPVGYGILNYLA